MRSHILFILLLTISTMDSSSMESFNKNYRLYKITGPSSYRDKIVIVGAGASGIHMALLLKEHGFTNVQILEKEATFGGKTHTVEHRGTKHDMGTVYLAPDYNDSIVPLVNKYIPNTLVNLPPASVWLDNLPEPITYEEYLIRFAMNYFQTTDVKKAVNELTMAILKYNEIHRKLFGTYEGEIMPEPTDQVLKNTSGTFLDFLKRHNLEVISPILFAASSMQGYGRINEIACLYGLMWNTPKLMYGLLARLSGKTKTTGLYMLNGGFQSLLERIVKDERLNITFNVEIRKVYRTKHDNYKQIWIKKRLKGQKTFKWEKYDFLIWSPEMKTSLKLWMNEEIVDERFFFNLTTPTFFTTSLIDSKHVRRGPSPIDYWFDNLNNKSRDGSVWAQRDSYAALRGYEGDRYKKGLYPSSKDGTNKTRTTIVYQMSDEEPLYMELNHLLNKTLRGIGATEVTTVLMKSWRYFPRYSPEDMQKKYLWKVLKMQGKYGMWYIGSSVSFESVKSVAEYNKLLLRSVRPLNSTS